MSSSALVDVWLRSLAFGGEAVGTLPDGRAVFVPFALPGEQVRIELVEEKPRFGRGRLVQVLQPAPERITPRCRHFGICGGCDYQHIPYSRQLEIKKEQLQEQLRRNAGIDSALVRDCVPSPQAWNYRNHVQFHLDEDGRLGYRLARSKKVISIEECFLPSDGIQRVWPGLDFEEGVPLDRIGVREGAPGDLQVILEGGRGDTPELTVEEIPVSVVHIEKEESVVLAGSEWVLFPLKERMFRVSAGSFFQVNAGIAEKMVEEVLEKARLTPQTTVLELYCGVGLFSAFLAEKVGRLVGIEASPAACEDFVFNLDEFEHVELYESRVDQALPTLSLAPQVILLDPPRSGAGGDVVQQIARLGAEQIIYISCDPATLARDAKELINLGYKLGEITPFDMFPQTAHIESISIWQIST